MLALLLPVSTMAARGSSVALGINVSSPEVCVLATDVCACAALAPGCGWCSTTGTCAPVSECTTTCRECPSTHKTCRSACRRTCVDTCALAPSVCACSELEGCGWCSHGQRCQPYPECSTTCEECDSSCERPQQCQSTCYQRFHAPRRESPEDTDLTFPPSRTDVVCALAIFLATVLASAAGIGGGAVLVPIFTLLGEFTEHEAIPLSIATVFGASAFSTLGNYMWQKHPHVPHRPVISYDSTLVLLPATLLGSTAGVFLNKLCPNWLIVLLLVLLCAFSGKRTLDAAWKRRAKEDKEVAYSSVSQVDDGSSSVEMSDVHEDSSAAGWGVPVDEKALAAEVAAESRFPYASLLALSRTWLVVMGLSMLKGGHGAPSLLGVTCGTLGYWAVVLLNIPVLGSLTYFSGRALTARHLRLVSIGYTYAEGDVPWDQSKVWQYSSMVAFGAIAAGMLGVGGGMILGPIFNELDFLPQVSSATSTIMVFFMSSANVGQFIVFGMLDIPYACYYGAVGVVGAIVGTKGAKALLDKTGRASFLVFFLAAILFGSGVLMAAAGIPQIAHTGFTGFRPICGRTGAAARKGD